MCKSVNPTAQEFLTAAASQPRPVCVTAFIPAESYGADEAKAAEYAAPFITVGTYMSNRQIHHLCTFSTPQKALRYAFILKDDNCPISKKAFALLTSECRKAREAEAAKKAAEEAAEAEKAAEIVKAAPLPVASDACIEEQYHEMKKKHPDAVLLFRVGDFYECFGEDAVAAADVLGITLTRRRARKSESYIELAGFPHHALDTYLPKLVRAGKRVAICEQLEVHKKPRTSKKAKEQKEEVA